MEEAVRMPAQIDAPTPMPAPRPRARTVAVLPSRAATAKGAPSLTPAPKLVKPAVPTPASRGAAPAVAARPKVALKPPTRDKFSHA